MSKKGEDIYEELRNGLIKPFIFYLPYDVLPEDVKSSINESPILKSAFNKIISISKDFKIHVDKISLEDIQIVNKSEQLDYLLMELIDLKDNLSPNLFEFIFEKYYQLTLGLDYVSNWMHLNFDNYFDDSKLKGKKTLFQFQAYAFKTHIEKLNSKIKYNSTVIKPVPDLSSYLKKELINLNLNSATVNLPEKPESVKSKKDKHITAAEARTFLLETVFNVKIKNK